MRKYDDVYGYLNIEISPGGKIDLTDDKFDFLFNTSDASVDILFSTY